MNLEKIKNIYFMGIGGIAMGGIAEMMQKQGYNVTGADHNVYPPMSDILKDANIEYTNGYNEENIKKAKPDLIVIGNTIGRTNPELEYVLNNSLEYISWPELLEKFYLKGKKNVVMTGTHGKTTTTALMAAILKSANKKTGYMIGGKALNFPDGSISFNSDNEYNVLEGDEYDTCFYDKRSKFMHYCPYITIMNNLEFDHADIFRDLIDIQTRFQHLIKIIPSKGHLILNSDDKNVMDAIADLKLDLQAKTYKVGFLENAEYRITNIKEDQNGASFTFDNTEFTVPLYGEHNIENTARAILAMKILGLSNDEIQKGLSEFKNVKRRLEVIGEIGDVTVIEDFAHHPTAIKKTIKAIKTKYPGRKLWVLCEMSTNTMRQKFFEKDIAPALEEADGIFIPSVTKKNIILDDKYINPENIINDLKSQGKEASYEETAEDIIEKLLPKLQKNDVIAILSNGKFQGIYDKLLSAMKEKFK